MKKNANLAIFAKLQITFYLHKKWSSLSSSHRSAGNCCDQLKCTTDSYPHGLTSDRLLHHQGTAHLSIFLPPSLPPGIRPAPRTPPTLAPCNTPRKFNGYQYSQFRKLSVKWIFKQKRSQVCQKEKDFQEN